MVSCRRFFWGSLWKSDAALYLGQILSHGCSLAVGNSQLAADELDPLFYGSAGILAPHLYTIVEDAGWQRANARGVLLNHGAFLLNGWLESLTCKLF